MQQKKRFLPSLERLEERATPASFTMSSSGSSLFLTQTAGTIGGTLTFVDDPSAGTFSYTDGGGTTTIAPTGISNITLTLLESDTAAITYTVQNAPRTGNLTLNVRNSGTRNLTLDNQEPILGNLTVSGGAGGLVVRESAAAGIQVNGNASFTGGTSFNRLLMNQGASSSIGGTLTLTRFNDVRLQDDGVGGRLSFSASGDGQENLLRVAGTNVGGALSYIGGNSLDVVELRGGSTLGSSVTVNFGNQAAGDTSELAIFGNTVVNGSVSVTGGNLGTETVSLAANSTIGGNITLNLGSGANTVTILGTVGGTSFSYNGGLGVDDITYTPAAGSNRLRFSANLGAGDDVVTFGTGAAALTNPSYASIDFGAGNDSVNGDLNFPFVFRNL